ncbi:MAG: hypothetical protein FWG69_00010 [Oscillospiraceae bacterium]|nr:hypothetical protein [Oscillospiraceae bacterium]
MTRTYNMRRKLVYSIIAALVITLFTTALIPVTASAAENPLMFTVNQTAPEGIAFRYRLKPFSPESPMPQGSAAGGYIITLTGNNSVQIGPLNFQRQGLYRYEISRVTEPEKPGYIYDKRVYTIEVRVDEKLNATLILINSDGTKADSVLFKNGYRAQSSDPALMVDPPVKKTVSGNPGTAGTFIFKLTAQKAQQPMPAGSVNGVKTLTIKGAGQGEFGTWSYETPGVYIYTVSEVNNGIRGYTYDTAVYLITDTVKDKNGQLTVSRTVTNGKSKSTAFMEFINIYTDKGKPDKPDKPDKPGKPGRPSEGKPGKPGPVTGDDIKTALYYMLIALGGAAAAGAIIYLIAGKKRKKDDRHENP